MKPSSRRESLVAGALLTVMAGAGLYFLKPAPAPVVPALERQSVTVSLAGEVKHPGVYTLPFGSRVQALIAKAGGYTAQAEPSLVNPVQILTDGDQVRVPSKLAAAALQGTDSGASAGPAERVNLNTASAAELESLPGVGPKLAQRILAGRPYANLKDLDKVKGIGPSMLKKLEPFVRF